MDVVRAGLHDIFGRLADLHQASFYMLLGHAGYDTQIDLDNI